MSDIKLTPPAGAPSPVEAIKLKSKGLRGTLAEGFENAITGAVSADDQTVIKFHGSYQQDDRDRRAERELKKLEWAYSYMIRLRLPGGEVSAQQWLGLTKLCNENASGVIKITTRQTIQIHGVVKAKMKPTMEWFRDLGVDTIAACGDVNRNVMAGADPTLSIFHEDVFRFAQGISEHLLPKTNAFTEVWLDGEKLTGDEPEPDPLYLKHYLPRKFKIAIATPPHNDTDVFTNDIGLISIEENGKFTGFNVSIGGGMGTTHGNPETYARLGTVIGFVPKEKILDTVWQIVAVQRDFGNRSDRKFSRLKYTVDRLGVDVYRAEVEKRQGFTFQDAKPYNFIERVDHYGWQEDHNGKHFCTLFVESGRVMDLPGYPIKTALKECAETDLCQFRFTGNQNIMLTHIEKEDRVALEHILAKHGIDHTRFSNIRKDALACVALNTCGLALAEAQRYLPDLISKIEVLLAKHKLENDPFSIRMTGCPNGCARPWAAEIGFIGKALGQYNLYLGGNSTGTRLNRLYKESLDEKEILQTLDGLFEVYAKNRSNGERFGDFIHRTLDFGAAA
ncbi:MAG: NADPH-dependent assimilatory sulfite reductase hemoprotein subunit [Alphaproteobacteria bacterium]|nr:NADPH-dependent assimilatory sulfite reductase hemoprotein subunit [Alphaproteobacteria bacterium]